MAVVSNILSAVQEVLTSVRNLPLVTSVGIVAGGITLYVYMKSMPCQQSKSAKVNQSIKKDQSKVVDTYDIEDIGDKKVFCRCWRSKIFPLCDGSHNKHNEVTGDNVGPLIVNGKKNSE